MWENDICWCADSENCTNTECFRHMDNREPAINGLDIFTCSHLIWTNHCPLTKESEV